MVVHAPSRRDTGALHPHRRQELSKQLEELGEDDSQRAELETEHERLSKLADVLVLVLGDPEVWTFGFNSLAGPLTQPYVRVDVASIIAWWPGSSRPSTADE